MNEPKLVKIPDANHPIRIARDARHIRISAGGRAIAQTRGALALAEANYPVVIYVPREDVRMERLTRSTHTSYCPYKGDCSYFSVPGAAKGENAVWSYETPYPAVAEIKGYLAFYPDRVDAIEVLAAAP